MLHRRPFLTLLALAIVLITIPALAQIDKGSVEAVALDQSKAPLPGVTVSLARAETGYETAGVTQYQRHHVPDGFGVLVFVA